MTAILAFFAGPIGRWIVVAALMASAAFAAAVHERNIGYEKGMAVGQKILEEQRKANVAAVTALDLKYRNSERDHKADLDRIGADHAKEMARADARRQRDIADARSGALRLSIPSSCNPDGSSPAQAGGPAAGGDGQARTELPSEVTASLFALADDADAVVSQLSACQAVIISDRQSFPPVKGTP